MWLDVQYACVHGRTAPAPVVVFFHRLAHLVVEFSPFSLSFSPTTYHVPSQVAIVLAVLYLSPVCFASGSDGYFVLWCIVAAPGSIFSLFLLITSRCDPGRRLERKTKEISIIRTFYKRTYAPYFGRLVDESDALCRQAAKVQERFAAARLAAPDSLEAAQGFVGFDNVSREL